MGKIKVEQAIKVYEMDGSSMTEEKLGVNSHEENNTFVVLKLASGKTLTVSGDDLIEASINAMNTGD